MSRPLRIDPELAALIGAIPPPDRHAAAAAASRLDQLTKPRGSLGRLEPLLVRLAAATGQPIPQLESSVLLLAAADHGVADEGVSAYPQAVTTQMVLNYLNGGAAVNALCTAAGMRLVVVDAGVIGPLPDDLRLLRAAVRSPAGNITIEPALQVDEATDLLLQGAQIADQLIDAGHTILAVGEMGIANTTPSAALTAMLADAPLDLAVGRGTGIDDIGLARKRAVVDRALTRAAQTSTGGVPPALWALAQLGGPEIALLAGAMLGAAARRVPLLLDGYITSAAALVASGLAPALRHFLFAAHRSSEPGHAIALARLGLIDDAAPLLTLDLRLGEGSGAALAMPIIVAAARALRDMATFEQAQVSERSDLSIREHARGD